MEVSLFPMKTLFVQSIKTNSPMIVTDTIMHCIVCALKQLHTNLPYGGYYWRLLILAFYLAGINFSYFELCVITILFFNVNSYEVASRHK